MKDYSILYYSKFRAFLWLLTCGIVSRLVFIIDICDCPVRIFAFICMWVYITWPQFHANWNIVVVFNWHTIELAMLSNNFSNNLKLVIRVTFNISLKCFLYYYFILQILNFNENLERISLKNHKFISEVIWVFIDRNPYVHCVLL